MGYLGQEEKGRSRELWKEAFPEDSADFQEYYYKEKIKGNRIMVREEDGRIISMLHLNPYRIMVKNQIWRCDYIVGVATAAANRHKGHMRALLTEMFADMYQEGRQFCFLMPADERIYLPFDFTYIFDQPHWTLRAGTDVVRVPYDLAQGSEHHPVQELADWMNTWLHKSYEVYAFRDEAYLEMLMKELLSEHGEMNLLYNEERLVGIECLWGQKEKEQRMFLCEAAYREEGKAATPAIMARIVHLQNFIKVIRLKKGCERETLSVRLRVEDKLCPQNDGTWLWHLTGQGSVLEKMMEQSVSEADQEVGISITIAELTAWLFGYTAPEEGSWTQWVQPLRGVYLDEVV